MKRPRQGLPSNPVKGQLICPTCGHTSRAVDGDWIVLDSERTGRRFRCPSCGARFGDHPPVRATA